MSNIICFKKYITKDDKNDKRFLCLACKSAGFEDNSGYYDYLGNHFKGANHSTSILLAESSKNQDGEMILKKDIDADIADAVEAFQKFRSRKIIAKIVPKQTKNEMCIEYTAFLLQHGLPYSLISDLVNFNKYIIQKYGAKSIEEISISNVKAAQISRECISKSFKESIYEDLQKYPFALMFDESSDITGPPFLCTHVRYVKEGEFVNRLLSLEQITEDATGSYWKFSSFDYSKQGFFEEKESFLKNNLIDVCSDKGPNMFSSQDKGLLN